MKNVLLVLTLVLNGTVLCSQTLFTYGNNAVNKEEFLRAYNKNKTSVDDKEKSLREYLTLYSKFKLKVKAAQDLKLDTLPQLSTDLQNFRTQIDETYMTNDAAMEQLVNEAFDHSQKDLHVIHFFTAITNTDSTNAINAMQEIYNNLQAGKKDYNKLAADVSAKYATVKTADIGYITAFTLPYEYEKIIYGVKTGDACKPYRSKNGLHIFKVVDERRAVGKWKIAQILLALPPGDTTANTKRLQQKADSIYLKLQSGADFAEMVKQYSDDKLTYLAGGNLPEFTCGKYELPFENEVFKLTKDGEISKPFATRYGYHIVKRMSNQPIQNNKNDAAYLYEIKQKVLQDGRAAIAKEIFNKQVVQQVNYKKSNTVKDADLYRYADSVTAKPGVNETKGFPVSHKIIYSNFSSKLYGSDWLNFVKQNKNAGSNNRTESYAVLLNKFVIAKSVEYYKAHLEDYNADFNSQMKEFKEGNLLFEIMEKKVWGNAASDTVGLQKYYNTNKNKYQWAASADVIIFGCSNKKSAEAALDALQNGKDYKKIAEESFNNTQADSGRYELAQITLPNGTTAKPGLVTPIIVNPTDGTAGFIKILQLHPANEQRSFDEARGLVINDYQNVLEEKWVEELKKKYPIKVDEKIFQSLIK